MRRTVVLGVGLLAVATGASLAPHAAPLYDGIGFPDEPYRYAQVLADDPVKTPPPTTATATLALADGRNAQDCVLTTAETGPQLLAFVPKGAITTTGTAGPTLGISASPVAPDKPAPADGPIAGDIYRIATSAPARWHQGSDGTISLRSPQGIPVAPTMEFRKVGGHGWQALATTRVGNDIWESPLDDLGDYALILPVRAPASKTSGSHTLGYVLAGAIGLTAAILIGVRLALRRRLRGEPDA